MNQRFTLLEAKALLRQKKYSRVIHLLTPQVFLFRSSAEYYFIIGYACLKSADFGAAYSYLKRGEDIEPNRQDIQLCLAVTSLRKRDEQGALQIWLDILEEDPENKRAQQGLELIKLAPDTIDWGQLAAKGMLDPLLPPLKVWPLPSPRILIRLGIGLGIGLGLLLMVLLVLAFLPKPTRVGEEILNTPTKTASQNVSGDYSKKPIYILSQEEVEQIFKDIRKAFVEYNDNQARILINRLVYSNAPIVDKERGRLLISHLGIPNFSNFRGEHSYEELISEVELYEGVHIRWKGRVSNLRKDSDAMRFDFLVGYQGNVIVEGTVAVEMPFAADLKAGDAVELIAKVILLPDSASPKESFFLKGVAVRIIR